MGAGDWHLKMGIGNMYGSITGPVLAGFILGLMIVMYTFSGVSNWGDTLKLDAKTELKIPKDNQTFINGQLKKLKKPPSISMVGFSDIPTSRENQEHSMKLQDNLKLKKQLDSVKTTQPGYKDVTGSPLKRNGLTHNHPNKKAVTPRTFFQEAAREPFPHRSSPQGHGLPQQSRPETEPQGSTTKINHPERPLESIALPINSKPSFSQGNAQQKFLIQPQTQTAEGPPLTAALGIQTHLPVGKSQSPKYNTTLGKAKTLGPEIGTQRQTPQAGPQYLTAVTVTQHSIPHDMLPHPAGEAKRPDMSPHTTPVNERLAQTQSSPAQVLVTEPKQLSSAIKVRPPAPRSVFIYVKPNVTYINITALPKMTMQMPQVK